MYYQMIYCLLKCNTYCCCGVCFCLHCCLYLYIFFTQHGEKQLPPFQGLTFQLQNLVSLPTVNISKCTYFFQPHSSFRWYCCKGPVVFPKGPSASVKHPAIIPKQLLSLFPESTGEQKAPQSMHFILSFKVLFPQIVLINVWVTSMSISCCLTVSDRSQWSWLCYHTYCVYRGDGACIPLW